MMAGCTSVSLPPPPLLCDDETKIFSFTVLSGTKLAASVNQVSYKGRHQGLNSLLFGFAPPVFPNIFFYLLVRPGQDYTAQRP